MKENFSVLLSIYSKEKPKYFDEALNSLCIPKSLPNQIVIVKDGPLTIELENIIEKYVIRFPFLFTIVNNEVNEGLGKALAKGLLFCKNNLVARMDSDDINTSDRFQKQLSFFEKNESIDICGMYIAEFFNNIGEEKKKIRKVPLINDDIYLLLKSRNPMNHVTVMFKKNRVLEAGNYETFVSFEDYYLWAKMFLNKCKFANIPEVGVYVRIGENMIGRRHGLKYFLTEANFFKTLHKLGIISFSRLYFNIALRLSRFLPSKILEIVYRLCLRE